MQGGTADDASLAVQLPNFLSLLGANITVLIT